jgi:hypothetical protein
VGLPGVTRSFASFSAATDEIGQSRIWAGFHYSFDVNAGAGLGQAVGDYVFQNFLQPRTAAHAATGDASILAVLRGVPTGTAAGTNLGADGLLPATADVYQAAGGLSVDLRLASATSSVVAAEPTAPVAGRTESPATRLPGHDAIPDDLLGSVGSWDAFIVSAPGMGIAM